MDRFADAPRGSLPEMLGRLADVRGTGITHIGGDRAERHLDFADIVAEAGRRAALLRERGLEQGERVALVVLDEMEMLLAFLGIALAGLVPVMVAPRHLARGAAHAATLRHIVAGSGARLLIASNALAADLDPDAAGCPVDTAEQAFAPGPMRDPPALAPIGPDAPCFLQYTSGSTGAPKGIIVTHGNIEACTELCARGTLRPDGGPDVAVSWLPLYHDMGLIGFFLTPLVYQVPLVLMSPMLFARRPALWLEVLHRKRATVSAAPPFAFPLLLRRLRDADIEGLDLGALRVLMCGAEPIRMDSFEALADRLAPTGFDRACFVPCYGLAEATLAVTIRDRELPVRIDRVSASALGRGLAHAAEPGESARTLVSCGPPVHRHRVTIADEAGRALGERQIGEIIVEGPAVSPGYYGNPDATAAALRGGRLHTGDLGYLHGGELYVCGRLKDLIIVRGANFQPQDFEWTVGRLDQAKGRTAVAFGAEIDGAESFILVLEAATVDAEVKRTLASAAAEAITHEHGVTPGEVVVVPPGTIPLTTSGKVQRGRVRELYHAAALMPGAAAAAGLGR